MAQRLVIGWDGSAAAEAALQWALHHGGPAERLDLVAVDPGAARRRVRDGLDPDRAAEAVREARAGLTVQVTRTRGEVARVLAAASAPEALVVLGGRGRADTRRDTRTSTAYRVVLAAQGPVVVVPRELHRGRDVVVGVVRRDDSRTVVLAAAAEAARRGQRLVAVHAWRRLLDLDTLVAGGAEHRARVQEEHAGMMSEVLQCVREAYPRLEIAPRAVHGRASDVLVAASRHASLLVLGRDVAGRDGGRPVTHSGMLLSRAPVLVVPPGTVVPQPAERASVPAAV